MLYRVTTGRLSGRQADDVIDEGDLEGLNIGALVRSGLIVPFIPKAKPRKVKPVEGDDEGTDD